MSLAIVLPGLSPTGERGNQVQLEGLEYRPTDGLVVRVRDSGPIAALGVELTELLRGSAFRIYRTCCDSTPDDEQPHADGCEHAKKGPRE